MRKEKVRFKGRKKEIELVLQFFEQDGKIIAHCPKLDLSGYGLNEEEAKSSFQIALEFNSHWLESHSLNPRKKIL